MAQRSNITLVELEYMEREVASAVEQAASRLGDGGLADEVHRFAEDHARHADEIGRMAGREGAKPDMPRGFEDEVRHVVDGLRRADEPEGLLVALVQAERKLTDFYQVPIDDLPEGPDASLLRRLQTEEQRHVDQLESHGAADLPELIDLGDADGSGSAVP